MDEPRASGRTVLVVEDDEDIRLAMRLALEEFGYGVVEASNGEEAIEIAWRTCPSIILMDLSLPLLDGLTATRRIREDPQMKNVPIVAVTAHHEAQFRTNALAAGCTAYTTKPIDFDWLNEFLGQLLPDEKLKSRHDEFS